MKSGFLARPASGNDASCLTELAIRSKAHWGYTAEFMTACRGELTVAANQINDPRTHLVVAEQQGEIIGFYALRVVSSVECELDAMFVEPAHIGTGIGRLLMQHAMRTASDHGLRTLYIQSDPNAAPFYQAMGGKLCGHRESDSIPGRDLPLFAVSIPATRDA